MTLSEEDKIVSHAVVFILFQPSNNKTYCTTKAAQKLTLENGEIAQIGEGRGDKKIMEYISLTRELYLVPSSLLSNIVLLNSL